ncbi:hypothetical protein [Pseudobacteriovorax antillogorgiicola]|uniref:Uncharacterized protein n=1 Tax=Pseudobacteriovorax antillogorgiicola TaxID=1513793 RepID=A0A1Y6CMA4_9BACT|nr:hypothetical protein [Pseudobacteriovorax antillogorgiicola]TCS44811.1 hypothetical protein EDD56_13140 [Pseudobacteriovorax antillogorgiicola]SMF77297.1 hypothetical protein SAMN06296036_13124 [Pseudobacteriovorax antillogorgiicola]
MKVLEKVLGFLEGKPKVDQVMPRRNTDCEMVFDVDCFIDPHRGDRVELVHHDSGEVIALVTPKKLR